MKKILIVNGPNLNFLGKREPEIYGNVTMEFFLDELRIKFSDIEIEFFQSNIEGEIINSLQNAQGKINGIILNAAAYSHTSIAIADAINFINIPVVEVHISNVYAREEYRNTMITAKKCVGVISGLGLKGYELALRFLIEKN